MVSVSAQEWKDYSRYDLKFKVPANWKVTSDTDEDGDPNIECEAPGGKLTLNLSSTDPGFSLDDQILMERLFKTLIPQFAKQDGVEIDPDSLRVDAGNTNNIKGVIFQALYTDDDHQKSKMFGVIGFFKGRLYFAGFTFKASDDDEVMRATTNRILDSVFATVPSSVTNTPVTTPAPVPAPHPPNSVDIAFEALKAQTKSLIESKNEIRTLALSSNGGWVVLYGKNGYNSRGLPPHALTKLAELNEQKHNLDFIAFAPKLGWLIIYDSYGYSSEGLPSDFLSSLHSINQAKRKINLVSSSPSG